MSKTPDKIIQIDTNIVLQTPQNQDTTIHFKKFRLHFR